MSKATEVLKDIKESYENTSTAPWRIKSVQGNPEYSAHYGVRSAEDYTVVHATSDWEGYGNGSSLRDANFIVKSRNTVPKLVSTLEELLAFHKDSGQKVHEWTNVLGGSVEESLRSNAKNYCVGCGYQVEFPCETYTIIEEGLK